MVPAEQQQEVEKEIVEATNGSARISWGEKVLYALVDKKSKFLKKTLDFFLPTCYNSFC